MNRTPKKGEPYQVCPHLAAKPDRTDRHFWHVPDRDPWIVLCDPCHAAFSERQPVEIFGETFQLAEDVPIVPGSSCIHHSAPGDVAASPPPADKKSQKAPTAERLTFRPKAKAPDFLPLIDRGLTALMEISRAFQAQAKARADADLRRMEIEAQATERILRLLDASTAAADRLTALAMEQDAFIMDRLRRLRDDWGQWGADLPPAEDAAAPRTSRRKPHRRV